MKNKIYIIDDKTYLNHINDEVHLYGLLHQLAFLAGRIKDEEDVFHVLDAAKRYGEIAEEKFQGWDIPGRYLVFGANKDLNGHLEKELAEVENSVYRLATAVNKTQKRANALQNIVIPGLDGTIRFITDALEEKEREEFARLKVIKRVTTKQK